VKKLINDPEHVVREAAAGMAAAHPDLLQVHLDPHYICRSDAPRPGRVALVSGGGSGHEPMHGGFVGPGMLSAACPGEIFTSPTPDQIFEATRAVSSEAGALHIVKNYAGDVMNFEMAGDLARMGGIRTLNVVIDDDVSVKDSLYTQGRRGMGTTIFAEKICGAAAEQRYDLKRLADLCRRVNSNGRSAGLALTSCITPARGTPTFELGPDDVEIGIGIHGEPGRHRIRHAPADELVEMLALSIIEDPAYTRSLREWDEKQGDWRDVEITTSALAPGDRVIAMVNGMGGTPLIELYVVYRKLAAVCAAKGLVIARCLVGTYITSLDMQGTSITLLRADDEMLDLWDAPVRTPALRWGM
jgi:dihydroxyacetone kinase-like protein